MRIPHSMLLVTCLAATLISLTGCAPASSPTSGVADRCVIPASELPRGWGMVPASEMPPIDKTPWWHENPQTLNGDETKAFLIGDHPIRASRVRAVIYENDTYRAVIFRLAYQSTAEAQADYAILARERNPKETSLALSGKQAKTILLMNVAADAPERDFFVHRFQGAVADE